MDCTAATTQPARLATAVALSILLLATTGCGGDAENDPAGAPGDGVPAGATSDLPAPEGAVGSVTGMPAAPGPGVSPIESIDPAGAGTGAADAARSADRAGMDGHDGDAAGTASLAIGSEVDMGAAPALPEPSMRAQSLPGATLPDPRDRHAAAAAPVPIVPGTPRDPPVATDATTEVSAPRRAPVGTEGATETTTIVVEPAPVDD